MDPHDILIKTENTELLLSRWEQGIWDEFPDSSKLKMESISTVSLSEQMPKSVCYTSSETMISDKAKLLREFYKCDLCQETLTSKQMLRQHKNTLHNDKKTFRCIVSNCVRAFTSANYLKNHVDIEHTDSSEARIPCPKKDCGLFFTNNYRLKRHIRQDHKQEKLYQCQICARKFASLEVRNNHMKNKHNSAPQRDNLPLTMLDNNYYRTEINKESENDTVYAASPISSRFESLNGQTSIDTTCEAQWLTKTNDSNPSLSKQIDRILCDIFSDKYQETLHSPLSSSELAIAIVSLEETNDDGKRKLLKVSSHLNSLISAGASPLKSSYIFNELDKKICTAQQRLSTGQYNPQNHFSSTVAMTGQNYPQSNTESEGHSTESQRSFLVNSSQHEEFSDLSMESHLKDVFSNVVDKWNVGATGTSLSENPIKLMDYTCLDTMFDDFHEILTNESLNNNRHYINGHSTLASNISGQKNHLLSLNNMHSKFLGGSQFNIVDHQSSRSNIVPSNQITTSNHEVNRRKMNNNVYSAPLDPNIRDPSFTMEIPSRCHVNPLVNGSICSQDGRMRTNYPQAYSYGHNPQLMGNNQMYYNRDISSMYVQQPDRSSFPLCINGPGNTNPLYHNSMETEFMNETLSQTNQYQNGFRRRAPPPYQVGFNHQMLPSQHSASASLSYCPQSMHRNSCYYPHNGGSSSSSRSVYADSSASSIQIQQQRYLSTNAVESQGQQSNSHHPIVATDNNRFSESVDSIVIEEQFSSTSVINDLGSQITASLSKPATTSRYSAGLSQNCDIISDAKTAVCM